MVARALARYIRISPKKLRLVFGLVKGKPVSTALSELSNLNKKAARFAYSAIQSAFNNARRKEPEKKLTETDFYVSKIACDQGPVLKRYRAASMGRAMMVRHRLSHLLVELDEVPGKKEQPKHKTPEKRVQKRVKKLSLRKAR